MSSVVNVNAGVPAAAAAELKRKIDDRTVVVGVLGLGYVGRVRLKPRITS